MENFVIVFLALLFFAVSIGAVDNYSNYNKTEKSVRDINSLKIKQKSINKSILKYKNTVIKLQKLKIISQINILKTQEANLSKCLRKQNNTSLHDEFISELEQTIEQQKLHIENQARELILRNNKIESLEATNKQNDIDQKQSASQQNIFRTQELILTDCRSRVNSQEETIQNQEHELTLRRNQIETLANEIKKKDVEINQLKKYLDYEILKNQDLSLQNNKIESLKATLEAIIKRKDIDQKQSTSQQKICRTQELHLTDCRSRVDSQEEIIAKLNQTNKQEELHLTNCWSKVDSQEEIISKLNQTNKQQELHLTDCRSRVDRQEEIIAKLNQTNKQPEYQNQNQSKLQQNQEHELILRTNKIEILENENKEKDVEIIQLKKDLDYVKLQNKELLDEFANDTQQLSKQLEDAKLKNQKLLIQYEEKVDELQNEKIANENCEKYYDNLLIEHGKLKRLVKDLETNNTDLDTKYNQQTTENKNLISSKTQLSDKLTVCLTTVKQKSAVIPSDKLSCPAFGNYSATHVVNIENGQSFKIPCNSDESNLVWSVIERRLDQSLDLDRRWIEYREGFGDFQKEFFIGLEKLHLMTKQQPHQLLIRLRVGREMKFAKYSHFEIAGEDENYAIRSLGKYSGDAGDGMRESEGKSFSTFDRDNDLHFKSNCAQVSRGGWWFDDCGTTNLNYQHSMKLVRWNNHLGSHTPIEMLIRPT